MFKCFSTRSERFIPMTLLYPINYWDYHGKGYRWGLVQGSFYMHEMTILIIRIEIIKGYLEDTDTGQRGHGQHANSKPNSNPNPNPNYYST